MSYDKFRLKGKIEIFEDGKKVLEKDNLIVEDGKELLLSRLASNDDNFVDYVGVGTDDTPVLSGDSTLGVEVDRNQISTKTVTAESVIFSATFSKLEALGSWKEAALFNASSSGDMFDRVIIDYTKGNTATTVRFTISYV